MNDPQMGMKQQHGGGDDTDEIQEEDYKKPKLDKYLHASDFNLSDRFERVILEYSKGENIDKALERIKYERMAFLRAGISAMKRGLSHLKMSKNRVAYYLVLILMEQDWKLAFRKLITESYSKKTKHPLYLIVGINKAFEKFPQKFIEWISELLRDLNNEEIVSLLAEMHNKKLITEIKKELVLIARDDVNENKKNAIEALLNILEDEMVEKLVLLLLKRSDEDGQMYTLRSLCYKDELKSPKIREQLKKLMDNSYNPHIKSLASRALSLYKDK